MTGVQTCALPISEVKTPSKGSHMSRENGSKMLVLRPPQKLGMRDMFESSKNKMMENKCTTEAPKQSFDQFPDENSGKSTPYI